MVEYQIEIYGISIALLLIAQLCVAVWRFSKLEKKVNTIEKRCGEIEKKCGECAAYGERIARIEERTERYTQSESPLSLTDKGKNLLERSGAERNDI